MTAEEIGKVGVGVVFAYNDKGSFLVSLRVTTNILAAVGDADGAAVCQYEIDATKGVVVAVGPAVLGGMFTAIGTTATEDADVGGTETAV